MKLNRWAKVHKSKKGECQTKPFHNQTSESVPTINSVLMMIKTKQKINKHTDQRLVKIRRFKLWQLSDQKKKHKSLMKHSLCELRSFQILRKAVVILTSNKTITHSQNRLVKVHMQLYGWLNQTIMEQHMQSKFMTRKSWLMLIDSVVSVEKSFYYRKWTIRI